MASACRSASKRAMTDFVSMPRSEEHTSELQSPCNLVCRLLLEKKEVQDLYHAEKQLVKALPKVAKKASSPQLKDAIEEHLHQTEGHVNRLEQIFQMLGQPAKGV